MFAECSKKSAGYKVLYLQGYSKKKTYGKKH